MEALGEKIRRHREEKGYSLDQVARDTHITRRFLESLETEDFSAMPGESYVIGFLRSYSEYLGLNADEMVSLYKNIKLQEQPAPIVELLERRGMSNTTKILIGAGIVVVIIAIACLIYALGSGSTNSNAQPTPVAASDQKLINFDGVVLEKTFLEGDVIRMPSGNSSIDMVVGYKGDKATLNVNGNIIELTTGKDWTVDVNQDGKLDIHVLVRTIDNRSNPAKIIMRLDRIINGTESTNPGQPSAEPTVVPVSGIPGNAVFTVAGTPRLPGRERNVVPLPEGGSPTSINVQLVVGRATVIRYQTDLGKKDEHFAQNGEVITINANSTARFWIADGNRVALRVNGKDTLLGNEGEVAAWQLSLVRNASGVGTLQLQPLY